MNQLKSLCVRNFAFFRDHEQQKHLLFISLKSTNSYNLKQLNQATQLFRISSLSYELKNQFETLSSDNPATISWPDILSFEADLAVILNNGDLKIYGDNQWYENHLQQFEDQSSMPKPSNSSITLTPDLDYGDYEKGFQKIKSSLQRGDIYELNYCVNAQFKRKIDPINTGFKLLNESESTFMTIANFDGKWILSGSPERFLKKEENRLLSQPIKGTAKRGDTEEMDLKIATELSRNTKERSENIMIVDLVRNDLSKVATKNSVNVDELCGLYSFKTVHQLISSVSCQLKENISFEDIIKASFPMGSMTGAPKVSAMKLIDDYESFKRSHYSGSLGYQSANGDFDFNVLIRSIFYDEDAQIGMAPAGGAITIESDCQKEYQEVLLKMMTMQNALQC